MKKLFTLAVGLIALTQSFAQVQRSQAVEILNNSYGNNAVPTNLTYATPYDPGQNRYIGLIYMAEFNSAISYPTAITYNGVPMTRLSGSQNDLTTKAVVQIWAINEAQLASAGGGTGTLANTPYPIQITWNSQGSGSYYMAINSFRYVSQTTSLPSGTRVFQGNANDSIMLPQTTVKPGDLIFHFSMFTRDQISDINTADSPNTRPVSTNLFMGAPIVNGLRPTPAAKQFLAMAWNNEAPANGSSFTYSPTFQRTSTQNPTKWIASGVNVPYVEFTKPVAGQVWIDANGNGVKDGNETVPNPSEYRVIAVSKSGSTYDIYNEKVRYIFSFDANGNWSGNVDAEFIREGPIQDPSNYAPPKYEFALVKTATLGGSLIEGQAPPSGIGTNSMGVAPGTGLAYYVHLGTAGTLPIASNGISSALLQPTDPGFVTQNIKFGIQSRPKNIDASIGAGTLKGKQFISLSGSPITASDDEDGLLQSGNKLIITKINETLTDGLNRSVNIKLAYVPTGQNRAPLESDVIPQSQLPLTINDFDNDNLYALYVSGDGSPIGQELFQYTYVDAAGATGGVPPTPGNQIGNGGQILGSGDNGNGVFSFTGVLPSTSLELAGSYNGGKASLRWKLNGTDDVARYELERGNNAAGFRSVATMSANGREYNHVDDLSAFTGADAFYRVKLVRTNGAVSYSNVISLKLATITGLQLMPTVVQSNLQVRFNNTRSQEVVIRVMNITGQAVMTQTSKMSAGNASISLNGFERLANGTYSVQVFAGTTVTQGKIVVQH